MRVRSAKSICNSVRWQTTYSIQLAQDTHTHTCSGNGAARASSIELFPTQPTLVRECAEWWQANPCALCIAHAFNENYFIVFCAAYIYFSFATVQHWRLQRLHQVKSVTHLTEVNLKSEIFIVVHICGWNNNLSVCIEVYIQAPNEDGDDDGDDEDDARARARKWILCNSWKRICIRMRMRM